MMSINAGTQFANDTGRVATLLHEYKAFQFHPGNDVLLNTVSARSSGDSSG